MMFRSFVPAFLLSAAVAYAQLDPNTITVTASKNPTLTPDQLLFSVSVSSGLNATLDDVLAALAGSGITQSNFSGVSTALTCFSTGTGASITPAPTVDWTFRLPVAFAKMKDTVAMLTALQKSITRNNSGLT